MNISPNPPGAEGTGFSPDWTCPTGEFIQSFLEERMANALHTSIARMHSILAGDIRLTEGELILLDTIFRDLSPQNTGKDLPECSSILKFLVAREAGYWAEVERLYTLTEEDAYASFNNCRVDGHYSFPTPFEKMQCIVKYSYTTKKDYLILRFPKDNPVASQPGPNPETIKTQLVIIKRLLHEEKVRYGMYWGAAIPVREVFLNRPCYIFTNVFENEFQLPTVTDFQLYNTNIPTDQRSVDQPKIPKCLIRNRE